MEETKEGGYITLSYASSVDYVLVEIWISKNKSVMFPASVVWCENGGYDIYMIDNKLHLSEETYGKRWRCWELKEPNKEERDRIPWE